jgi:hypothetical protein
MKRLGWDEDYSKLQIEPHLRSATPIVLPAYSLHLNIWLPADRRTELCEDLFSRFVKLAENTNETATLRHSVPLGTFDADNYFVSNCSWDWEIARPGKPLFVCRLELHQEYCSITVFLPWRGRQKSAINSEFWASAESGTADNLKALYKDGLRACRDFLCEYLDLNTEFLAGKEEGPESGTDVREFSVFGVFEGLTVPESYLSASEHSAFELKEGRYDLSLPHAQNLLVELSPPPPGNMPGSGSRIACGMLDGQALYVSTIGYQRSLKQRETLQYLVVYSRDFRPSSDAWISAKDDQFNWPLSRLVYRLHEIGTRRLAALRDLEHIWRTGTKLRDLEAEAETIELAEPNSGADKDLRGIVRRIHQLRKEFRERGEKIAPKQIRHNLDDRLASAELYASAVKSLVKGLGVKKLGTYQDYEQFIWRRLYRRFEYIRLFGRRLDRLHDRTRALIQHRLQDRGDSLQTTAHVIGTAIFAVETSSFLSEVFNLDERKMPEEWMFRTLFLIFGAFLYWVGYEIVRRRLFPHREEDIDP